MMHIQYIVRKYTIRIAELNLLATLLYVCAHTRPAWQSKFRFLKLPLKAAHAPLLNEATR